MSGSKDTDPVYEALRQRFIGAMKPGRFSPYVDENVRSSVESQIYICLELDFDKNIVRKAFNEAVAMNGIDSDFSNLGSGNIIVTSILAEIRDRLLPVDEHPKETTTEESPKADDKEPERIQWREPEKVNWLKFDIDFMRIVEHLVANGCIPEGQKARLARCFLTKKGKPMPTEFGSHFQRAKTTLPPTETAKLINDIGKTKIEGEDE